MGIFGTGHKETYSTSLDRKWLKSKSTDRLIEGSSSLLITFIGSSRTIRAVGIERAPTVDKGCGRRLTKDVETERAAQAASEGVYRAAHTEAVLGRQDPDVPPHSLVHR